MKREEQKIKLHFLQMSSDFFEEDAVQDLLEEKNGNDYMVYYLRAHCAALKHGKNGILEIPDGKEAANYIRRKINASISELPMIAAAMQACVTYGLIKADRTDGRIASLDFVLTEKYTRTWTKDALERRQKRIIEAGQAAPQIENVTDEPKVEEKEDPIDYTAIRDAWNRMAESAGLDHVIRITDKRRAHIRARVKEYGVDQCLAAIKRVGESPFLRGENDRGWQAGIDWLCGTSDAMAKVLEGKYAPKEQPAQPTKEVITEKTVQDAIRENGLFVYGSGYDLALWDQIKPRYSAEMQAAIEKEIKQ